MSTTALTHWEVPIRGFHRSFALLSKDAKTDTAVVLVHGFLGDAHDTWFQLQWMVTDRSHPSQSGWWSTCDVYLFGYASVTKSLASTAEDFESFLEYVYPNPPDELFMHSWIEFPTTYFSLRPSPCKYKRLLLVGHSAGAVVIREAVRRARHDWKPRQRIPKILKATLRCFSPAISGARVAGLLGFLKSLSAYFGLQEALTFPWSPSYAELKDSSAFLSNLKDATLDWWKEDAENKFPALRSENLWAYDDHVVHIVDYRSDHQVRPQVRNRSHSNVCKPDAEYPLPLQFIERGKLSGK